MNEGSLEVDSSKDVDGGSSMKPEDAARIEEIRLVMEEKQAMVSIAQEPN